MPSIRVVNGQFAHHVSVYLTVTEYRALRAEAAAKTTSMTALCRKIMSAELKRLQQKHGIEEKLP